MLPKVNRLRRKKDFEQVFKKGKGFKEDILILKFVSNNLGESRFGISVSQKISKKATVRNKLKRKITAIIGSRLPEIKKGIDVVLMTRPGLETKDFWEIEETIKKLFKKAKIINYPSGARGGDERMFID